jgi:hypothetical protein
MTELEQKLIEMADILMKKYNPCHLEKDSCIGGNPNPCCFNSQFGKGVCPYLKGGCTNINCGCKLWICETAIKNTDPKCVEALRLLEKVAEIFGLDHDPFIGDPYVGADKVIKELL